MKILDHILQNRNTYLFFVTTSRKMFLYTANIWRVLWRGENERIIVVFRSREEIKEFIDLNDLTFLVTYNSHGDPSRFDEDNVIAEFSNCQIRNKWMKRLVAHNYDELDEIPLYIEYDCEIRLTL